MYARKLGKLTTDQSQLIMGFDALLFLGSAKQATLEYTK